MMGREVRHIPVLLGEVMAALLPAPGKLMVDCTVGLGGHSVELLRRVTPGGRLIGLDLDGENVARAKARLVVVEGGQFEIHQGNFAGLPKVLALSGVERADGILADLGVASPQIDDAARGFSYRQAGPLDMRMDRNRGQPASVLVNRMDEEELARALFELGDEGDAARIAELIVKRRRNKPIETTEELTAIVCEARDFTLKRAAGAKLHPAARTFQALRMLVNRELGNLERLLAVLPECLARGGVAAVISFHSGEDRLVKRAFREGLGAGVYGEIARDPVVASEDEREANGRSRSAKLRWARRA